MAEVPENDVPYSLDEDFDELLDGDKTVELVGFVSAVEAPIKAKQYDLFKFGLSNGSTKKVMCLIWNSELINTLRPTIEINKIIHIDGAHCKASRYPRNLIQAGYLPFEIIIQKSTVIDYLGMREPDSAVRPPIPPREVNFENINDINNGTTISINGYMKTEFKAVQSQFAEATYACGSITDGVFKITVTISNYQTLNFIKGTAVNVIGEIKNSSGLLTIKCEDSSKITPREGVQPLTELRLMRGIRLHKRKNES